MNIEKHLILIKGEDKTDEVSHCEYENGKWQVKFATGRAYSYNYLNVLWLRNPVSLDAETTVVYKNNQPLSGVAKIFDFGGYIRICFVTGYKKVYRNQELTVEQSCLHNVNAHNCFAYLKKLAEKVSVVTEEDHNFLRKQYEKIAFVAPSSVLAKYLNLSKLNSAMSGQMPIFPFGFNLSQKDATEKALSEQISVIEGPPGTGKTQTILNIIANAIINGKTVAVVSNNNAATSNVLEKLQKYGVDFITAYLGNKANKEKFFAEQTQTYPIMDTWVMHAARYNSLRDTLMKIGSELKEMLKIKNKVAELKQERLALLVEKEYFDTYYNETCEELSPYRSLSRHRAETVLAFWLDYQRTAERDNAIT